MTQARSVSSIYQFKVMFLYNLVDYIIFLVQVDWKTANSINLMVVVTVYLQSLTTTLLKQILKRQQQYNIMI